MWCFTRNGDFTWMVSDCEELVGEINHTTECVTDLFSFVDVGWLILLFPDGLDLLFLKVKSIPMLS